MKTKTLSKQDFDSLKYHVRRTIASQAKAINDSIDTYSTQYCWSIVEAIAELIRAMAMSENRVLTYDELVEYHNKLRKEEERCEGRTLERGI